MSTALLPPGNISSGIWTWEDPLFGFSQGVSNRIWFSWIHYNAKPSKEKKDLCFLTTGRFLLNSLPNRTFYKIRNVAHLTGLSPLYIKAIEFGDYVIIALNATNFFRGLYKLDLSNTVGICDKFFVVVFKATPYLMVVTNVALMALQLRDNQMRAIAGLVTTFVVIPLLRSSPKRFSKVADFGISLSLEAMTFYYGDNLSRFCIISNRAFLWALSTEYGRKIQSNLLSRIRSLVEGMHTEMNHPGDCGCSLSLSLSQIL